MSPPKTKYCFFVYHFFYCVLSFSLAQTGQTGENKMCKSQKVKSYLLFKSCCFEYEEKSRIFSNVNEPFIGEEVPTSCTIFSLHQICPHSISLTPVLVLSVQTLFVYWNRQRTRGKYRMQRTISCEKRKNYNKWRTSIQMTTTRFCIYRVLRKCRVNLVKFE